MYRFWAETEKLSWRETGKLSGSQKLIIFEICISLEIAIGTEMGRKSIFDDASDRIRLQVDMSKRGIDRLDNLVRKLDLDRSVVIHCALAILDDHVERCEKEGAIPILISPLAKFV